MNQGFLRISRQALLALFISFAFAACGGGGGGGGTAGNGTVSGTLTDISTGAPIAGARIGDDAGETETQQDGGFTLSLPPGDHTLSASTTGYMKTNRAVSVSSGSSQALDWRLTKSHGRLPQTDPFSNTYTILAWNDLGMHCTQDDFSYFLILPPFNTLHVQVIQRGMGPITTGVTVSYAFPKKQHSTLHTNFWENADKYVGWKDKYGWQNIPDVGITGTPLSGPMAVDANNLGFEAVGIPITPWDDDGTWDPYGTAIITVADAVTGAPLQTASVVAPVSTELNCQNCHGYEDAFRNILQRHDRKNGTTLLADRDKGILHLCAECHEDNALGLPGKTGVKSLSLAMHGFHKDKMNTPASYTSPDCYNCHPGPKTQCLRGHMFNAHQTCSNCHGDMTAMAQSIENGRKPWLQEPKCGTCHGAKHEENPETLYRNSVLLNTWNKKMSGKIYCEACHNSTHAEFSSTNDADNSIPRQFQGDGYWIWNCWVCHTDYMTSPSMHR